MRKRKDGGGLREIAHVLLRIRDVELMERFLAALLTDREAADLTGRWELVKRLHGGETQRSIAKELGMSLCKITRGSKELKKPNSPVRRVVELWMRAH